MTTRITTDGIDWHKRAGMYSFQQLTNKQIMDLLSAKKEIVTRSRKDVKKTFYLNVDDDGEVSVATDFDADASAAAYKNGSEIALPKETVTPEPKVKGKKRIEHETTAVDTESVKEKGKKSTTDIMQEVGESLGLVSKKSNNKTTKKTSADENATTMTKKKEVAKKAAGKKPAAKVTREGVKKTLKVSEIIKLQNSGITLWRQVEPHYILIPQRIAQTANKDKTIDVIVGKKA